MRNTRHYDANVPVTTQTFELTNRTLATPLVDTLIEVFEVLLPAAHAVTAEQVIVRLVFVLLNIDTTSPEENVVLGTVIVPFAFDCSTNLPTSSVVRVYAADFCPTAGMFMNPRVDVVFGSVSLAPPEPTKLPDIVVFPYSVRLAEICDEIMLPVICVFATEVICDEMMLPVMFVLATVASAVSTEPLK